MSDNKVFPYCKWSMELDVVYLFDALVYRVVFHTLSIQLMVVVNLQRQ